MNDEEYEIVKMIGEVWNKFRLLPQEHPDEAADFCVAIHSLQHKIMSREFRRCEKAQEQEAHEPRDSI